MDLNEKIKLEKQKHAKAMTITVILICIIGGAWILYRFYYNPLIISKTGLEGGIDFFSNLSKDISVAFDDIDIFDSAVQEISSAIDEQKKLEEGVKDEYVPLDEISFEKEN